MSTRRVNFSHVSDAGIDRPQGTDVASQSPALAPRPNPGIIGSSQHKHIKLKELSQTHLSQHKSNIKTNSARDDARCCAMPCVHLQMSSLTLSCGSKPSSGMIPTPGSTRCRPGRTRFRNVHERMMSQSPLHASRSDVDFTNIRWRRRMSVLALWGLAHG